jgi:hypothetical protein
MADDIKKDADAQRAKQNQAPQPREKGDGGSLSGVIDAVRKGNEEQTRTTEAATGLVANMVNIANSVERVGLAGNAAIDTLANNLSGNKLKELETAKENEKRDDKTNELLEELVDNTDTGLIDSPKGFFGTALAVLGGITGALAGIIGGFAIALGGQVAFVIKNFTRPFRALFSFLSKGLGKLIMKLPGVEGAKSGIKGIRSYLTSLNRLFGGLDTTIRKNGKLAKMNVFEKGIKNLGKFFRAIKTFPATAFAAGKSLIGTLSTTVKGFFAPLKNLPKAFNIGGEVKELGQTFDKIKSGVSGIVRPFTKTAEQANKIGKLALMVVQPFRIFSEFFKLMATKFTPLGKLLGKLFLPVTIIMGIFDGIKGAITGAAEQEGTADKFIGGIFGAIKGILVGLVGMPLDLLKDLVAWIAGKLGMDSAAEALSNFSFSGLIGNIIDTIRDFFGGIVDFVVGLFTFDGEKIKGGFSKITDAIGNVLKPLLRSILPDPTADLFSIAGIASKAIPSFIYDYAGINKDTGEMKPLENSIFDTVKKDTGDQLNNASIENESNKSKSDGLTANTAVDNSTKSSSNQTINIMGPSLGLATANELRFQG